MENSELRKTADLLIEELLKHGFVIQRYDAYSTNSIYLKLDYGVCNSIRISDHKGKKYLKYRYNIGPNVRETKRVKDKFDRFYYPSKKWRRLVDQILKDKDIKLKRYGPRWYLEFMRRNQIAGEQAPGFWRQAYLVERK